ncbi:MULTISPECIES: helix-turn-helix domain-containing protein [unclassified Exiguobacterium]|uniref:helix-turn-helix domain-containing protein n=1 Tax=unclassified Exiguobacterium TaxID=2644629 RepID=UPI001BE979AA|nr:MULTISPECIES: helix-turn-helix transcriptional regulator [unclassified Exiguobacterium]
MLKFGDLLKQLRKEKKLTQKELAEDLELDQSSISNYESNKKLPDVDTMMKMAIVFDVPVQELIDARNYTAHGIKPSTSYFDKFINESKTVYIPYDREKKSKTVFDENILKNIPWEVDGQEVTPEEVEEAIKYIKFQRTLRDKDK